MTLLVDWFEMLGTAGLAWFWRPLLAWTLVCVPLYAGLRLWRSAPPLVQYHGHLALLLALPLSLALAPFIEAPSFAPEVAVLAAEAPTLPGPTPEALPMPDAAPVPAVMPVPTPDAPWGMAHWLGLLTALAATSAVFLLLRMMVLAYGLRGFRRGLVPVKDAQTQHLLGTLATQMGVRDAVTLYHASDETTPMTFGWLRPVIVLPVTLLGDEPALRLTLRHELIHVRRRDYAVSWVVRLISALMAVHPGVWLLRRRIDQYREISCDAETLAETPGASRRYARLLLRFSPLTDLAGPAALRMANLDSTLKKRINAMHNPLRFTSSRRLRRWSLPLAAALLLIPALLAACATENTTSETVIVTAENDEDALVEEIEELRAVEEELAQQERELAFAEQRLAIEEAERAYREAVERLNAVHERGQNERIHAELAEQLQRARAEQVQMREQAFTQQEFKRLGVQMEYLQQEIKKISDALEKMKGAEYEMTIQRYQLLNALYMERLEKYETLKMEQFTREALANSE